MSTVKEVFSNWDNKKCENINISHEQLLTVDVDDCMIAIYITQQYNKQGRCKIILSTEFTCDNFYCIPEKTENIDNIALFIAILIYQSRSLHTHIFVKSDNKFSDDYLAPYRRSKKYTLEVVDVLGRLL